MLGREIICLSVCPHVSAEIENLSVCLSVMVPSLVGKMMKFLNLT